MESLNIYNDIIIFGRDQDKQKLCNVSKYFSVATIVSECKKKEMGR